MGPLHAIEPSTSRSRLSAPMIFPINPIPANSIGTPEVDARIDPIP